MAYAFNKVDDYFRKNKMGAQGSLEKGNMGAPAPTAAAENLAASAENSPAQGASETGQFRAAKGANTAAIQSGLTQPAQRQVQNWTTSETAKAGEATKAGEAQIGQTYKPFEAGDVAKAEAGQATPLTQQINYTGKELTFNPYQVQMPAIESQQQLAGGVGGMQAALQKQKGGRYTSGMGALDASVLAGSNQGMQGVRNALGGLRETARGTQQNLEKTDENLATKASTTAQTTKDAVRAAIQARTGQLATAQQNAANTEAQKLQAASKSGMTPEAFYNALAGTGKVSAADISYMQSPEYAAKQQYAREAEMGAPESFVNRYNDPRYQTTTENTYSQAVDPAYQNLANIWNLQGGDQITPTAATAKYNTYGFDPTKINAQAQNIRMNVDAANRINIPVATQEIQGPQPSDPFNPASSPVQGGTAGEAILGGLAAIDPTNWSTGGKHWF